MSDKKTAVILILSIIFGCLLILAIGYTTPEEESNVPKSEPRNPAIIYPISENDRLQDIIDSLSSNFKGLSIRHDLDSHFDIICDELAMIDNIKTFRKAGLYKTDATDFQIAQNQLWFASNVAMFISSAAVYGLYKNSDLDRISVNIYLNSPDDYGNNRKIKIASYNFNRKLYNKINWDNLNLDRFIKIAPNFKFYSGQDENL